MTQPTLDGLEVQPEAEGELLTAARLTIGALREQNAIQTWHELDCAIVLETAKGVMSSRGIAKSQMVTALLAARAKLPEPVVHESDDVLRYEADRELEWEARHGSPADPADVSDTPQPAPV